jgi:hypothetical protein
MFAPLRSQTTWRAESDVQDAPGGWTQVSARVLFFGCDRHAAACPHRIRFLPLVWFLSRSCFWIARIGAGRRLPLTAPILIRRKNETEPAKNFKKYSGFFRRGRVPRPPALATHRGEPACCGSRRSRPLDRPSAVLISADLEHVPAQLIDLFVIVGRRLAKPDVSGLDLQRRMQLDIAELHYIHVCFFSPVL